MKKLLLFSFMVLVLFNIDSSAGSKGPTWTTVTESILNVMEDGKWYPKTEWNIKGMQSGEELKTAIKDANGKIFADASWQFTANYDDDWAKVTGCLKFSPKGHPSSDYPNLPIFSPGKYKLEFLGNGKVFWETPFEINMTKIDGKSYYACSGPWKELAYIYEDDGSNGGIVNFWFEGPPDPKWYWSTNSGELERTLELKTEVLQNGEVLMTAGPAQYDDFKNHPGKAGKFAKSVGYSSEFKPKVMAKDGEYRVIVYASDQYKNNWNIVVDFTFPVVNGQIPINESLSGESSDPPHRSITSAAYYVKGAVKYTIPNYK